MPYALTLDGQTFSTDDLTIAEAEEIETATGESWVLLNPFRSVKHFKAIATAFLHRAGKNDAEVAALLDPMTMTAALDSVEIVRDDLPTMFEDGMPDPKAGDGEPTPT